MKKQVGIYDQETIDLLEKLEKETGRSAGQVVKYALIAYRDIRCVVNPKEREIYEEAVVRFASDVPVGLGIPLESSEPRIEQQKQKKEFVPLKSEPGSEIDPY